MNTFARMLALLVLAAGLVTSKAAVAAPRFGLEGSLLRTKLPYTPSDAFFRDTWVWTGGGGATVEWNLGRTWTVATGIGWAEQYGSQDWRMTLSEGMSTATISETRETRLSTLVLPVTFAWRHGRWRVGAGPQARYLLHGERSDGVPTFTFAEPLAVARRAPAGPNAEIFEPVPRVQDITDILNRAGLDATAFAAYDLSAAEHVLRLEAGWTEGLTNLPKGSSFDYRYRTRALRMGLGLLW